MMWRIQKHGMKIIFIQALVATLGSLYYGFYGDPAVNLLTGDLFNPANGLTPCVLCRFARILMYPLTLISAVSIIRKDNSAVDYMRPFLVLGIPLEIYHYALQKLPIKTSAFCTYNNPCNALEVDYFWFMTIPLLCLIAFVVILIVALLIRKSTHATTPEITTTGQQ